MRRLTAILPAVTIEIRHERFAMTTQFLFSIDVGCAIIRRDGKILITKRQPQDYLGGLWEFPGGKRLGGESLGACLEREIWEELGIRIRPLRFLKRIDHRYPFLEESFFIDGIAPSLRKPIKKRCYPKKKVSLYFYECEFLEGEPWPHRSQEFRWVQPFELKKYSFPPADEAILKDLSRRLF